MPARQEKQAESKCFQFKIKILPTAPPPQKKRMKKGSYHKPTARGSSLSFQLLYSGPTKEILTVMVNFTRHLDWVAGCPNIPSNIILDVSRSVFLRLTFELANQAKEIAFPNVDGPCPIT